MLRGRTYKEVCSNFKWEIPEYYNLGVDVCDKWAGDKNRLALIYLNPHGIDRKYTFRELRNISNRLANALKAHGIIRGDRVGIPLSQRPETLISHISTYKLGAIAKQLLAQIVGLGKAKELVFTGDFIDAQEAMAIGLANKVVPAESLLDESMAMARRIGEKSPLALKLSRITIDQGLHSRFEQTLDLEAGHLMTCAGA